MIIIALGANLPSSYGTPIQTMEAAKKVLLKHGAQIPQEASYWKTKPIPYDPDIPWYFNTVVEAQTDRDPKTLLNTLLGIEEDFGRVRTVKNAPRLLDLDLIAYNDQVIKEGDDLIVPHPRMHGRGFVLYPLQEIAPAWEHPTTKAHIRDLIFALPEDQEAERVSVVDA